MLSLYIERDSWFHRIKPEVKLLFFLNFSTLLFFLNHVLIFLGALGCILLFYRLAKIPFSKVRKQIRQILPILIGIFVLQILTSSWESALIAILRMVEILLLASLVTLTTRTSEMTEVIERVLKPFSKWISIQKVSLAISLAFRFIPLFVKLIEEVKEAQCIRGRERRILTLVIPILIRTLRMGHEITEALEARSF